ncbi:MAG TPA: hypothetical protein VLL52_15945 [Anaerolineae bacterium]|nr:hypothetical protein [Anaerolineae bacterium]
MTTYTETDAVADANTNYFYAIYDETLSQTSNTVGIFTYRLTPGN